MNGTQCSDSGLSWEIIVVDDNSPDGTLEIAKQLAGVYGTDKIVSISQLSLGNFSY
jgi:glycosyltransferase involved in cell wall biosynthesis